LGPTRPGFESVHDPGLRIRHTTRVRIRTRPGFESVHDPGSNPYTTRVRIRTRPGFERVPRPGFESATATRVRIRTRPGFDSVHYRFEPLRGNSWSFPPGQKTTPPDHLKKTKLALHGGPRASPSELRLLCRAGGHSSARCSASPSPEALEERGRESRGKTGTSREGAESSAAPHLLVR